MGELRVLLAGAGRTAGLGCRPCRDGAGACARARILKRPSGGAARFGRDRFRRVVAADRRGVAVAQLVVGLASQTYEHSFSRSLIPQPVALFMATPPKARQACYPSPKAVGAISSRSQVQIRRMLLEGNPVIVAMRPHERPSRSAHVLYLLGPLPADPLAPTEVLSGVLYPLQPRQRPLPGQVALHLREDDGQVQHRPPHGAVLIDGFPEADDLDLVLPQPSQQLQKLGQRPAQAVQRRAHSPSRPA